MRTKGRETMIRKLRTAFLGVLLLICASLNGAAGQTIQSQQPSASVQNSRRPPIEHYYLQFLHHQNELDEWAERQAAKGHDGSALRNHMQKDMGFSDADYAPIRASSVRLTAELTALNAQAVALGAGGTSPAGNSQMMALFAQRDTDVNAEVAYLKSSLPPDKIAKLEAYMVQFFSPKHASSQHNPSSQQPVPTAVKP